MRLESVVIQNFRSIKNVEIQFSPTCLILAGINESGKSNILRALFALGDFQPGPEDVREPSPNEEPINSSTIEFSFSLELSERKVVLGEIKRKVLHRNNIEPLVSNKAGQTLDLESFVFERCFGMFEVDVMKRTRAARYWSIDEDEYELISGWMKPSPTTFISLPVDGIEVSEFEIIFAPAYPEIPAEYLVPASIADVTRLIGTAVANFISKSLPKAMLWQYKEANLLPSSVSLDSFVQNPDSCIPLKNMFVLAGIQNITEAITEARSKSRNALNNFFARVSQKTTEHFRSVWKEHDTIQFELRPDGENLIPGVRERNVFDFTKRSDGFKRFVSFLLLVSANVKSGVLANTLLLVDEPEISLHPSGARFLRDELIKISESNLVVYSTHSIFMIDRERVDRHLIVSKINEETQVKVADDTNLFVEEVIYNALGYSVFETLRQKNLIFQGWRDKHLFSVATKKLPSSHTTLRDVFKDVGLCHAKGVKQIKSITPLIELANRKCVIISDGDDPAKEKQAEYVSDQRYGLWKRYDELLVDAVEHITGEDFVKAAAFRPLLKDIQVRHPDLPNLDDSKLGQSNAKLREIDRWLGGGGVSREQRKAEITKLKEKLFDNLKPSDVEPRYFEFLSELAKAL
jgi:hypothetical protein